MCNTWICYLPSTRKLQASFSSFLLGDVGLAGLLCAPMEACFTGFTGCFVVVCPASSLLHRSTGFLNGVKMGELSLPSHTLQASSKACKMSMAPPATRVASGGYLQVAMLIRISLSTQKMAYEIRSLQDPPPHARDYPGHRFLL